MIADLVSVEDRIEAYGIQRIGLNAGWAIGPAIGGFLATLSYFWLFFITAWLFLIGYGITYFFIQESHQNRAAKSRKESLRELLAVRKNHDFLLFAFWALLIFSIMTQIVSTLSVYAVNEVGLDKVHLGFLYTINGVTIIFLQFPGIAIIRRMRLTTALTVGALAVALGYAIVIGATSFWGLAVAILMFTIGEIFITPAGTTLTSNWAPASEKGRYMGVYGLFQSFGRSFGPFYGGFLLDAFMHQPVILWGTIAAVGILSALGFYALRWRVAPKINLSPVEG
jgi:MFS family permease